MPFFGPLEPPKPPPRHQVERPAWSPPDKGELGGFVPLRLELGRSADHVVLLGPMEAHPTGVHISLLTRSRVPSIDRPLVIERSEGALRFGVEFSDGRSAEHGPFFRPDADMGDGPVLMGSGGGGGSRDYRQDFWLWPLPPLGPVHFHLLWEDAGIAEASAEVDAQVFIDAARRAETLWPPLTPEEEQDLHARLFGRRGRSSMLFAAAPSKDSVADPGAT